MTTRFVDLDAGPLEAARAACAAARRLVVAADESVDALDAAPRPRTRWARAEAERALHAARVARIDAEALLRAAEQHEREIAARHAGREVGGDDDRHADDRHGDPGAD